MTPQAGETWQHFKGTVYRIVAVGLHSETQEQMVVYHPLEIDSGVERQVWVRPLSMWESKPEVKSTEKGHYNCKHSMQDHFIKDGKMWCQDCLDAAGVGRFVKLETPAEKLAKLNKREFAALLAKECPHVGFDPEGEPLAGNDPHLPLDKRVWGRLFINSGWYDLVLRTARRIEAEIMKVPEADRKFYYLGQAKEKYAGLKFYMCTPFGPHKETEREAGPGWDASVTAAIKTICDEADAESYSICEDCGRPGQPRMYAWEKTHCDECFTPDDLDPEAWEGSIAVDTNRLHGEHGSVEIPDVDY